MKEALVDLLYDRPDALPAFAVGMGVMFYLALGSTDLPSGLAGVALVTAVGAILWGFNRVKNYT